MHPFNRSFVTPRSSADTSQTSNPSRRVSPVPTRSTLFGSGFVDYNQHQTAFMNLLNHPSHGTQNYTVGTQIKKWEESGRLKASARHKYSARHYASQTSSRIHNR
ncbi:hypothetical protein Hanom_Chr09g00839641 [Helianthus anomalus]